MLITHLTGCDLIDAKFLPWNLLFCRIVVRYLVNVSKCFWRLRNGVLCPQSLAALVLFYRVWQKK